LVYLNSGHSRGVARTAGIDPQETLLFRELGLGVTAIYRSNCVVWTLERPVAQ